MSDPIRRCLAALVAAAALGASGAAIGDEAAVRQLAEKTFPGAAVETMRRIQALGLYEVYIDGTIVYIDSDASFLLAGSLFDGPTLKNLTQDRLNQLSAIDFSALPLDLAVKTVRGRGTRVLVTFEDPNCVYCRALAKELAQLGDVTIYTFLYPILSPDSRDKSRAIWCASDRVAAWQRWMESRTPPTGPGLAKCDPPVDKVLALGKKWRIAITPTMFLASGRRLTGFMPAGTIEGALVAAAKH
jgi:thiol:disulfide interchange protein DsbC